MSCPQFSQVRNHLRSRPLSLVHYQLDSQAFVHQSNRLRHLPINLLQVPVVNRVCFQVLNRLSNRRKCRALNQVCSRLTSRLFIHPSNRLPFPAVNRVRNQAFNPLAGLPISLVVTRPNSRLPFPAISRACGRPSNRRFSPVINPVHSLTLIPPNSRVLSRPANRP